MGDQATAENKRDGREPDFGEGRLHSLLPAHQVEDVEGQVDIAGAAESTATSPKARPDPTVVGKKGKKMASANKGERKDKRNEVSSHAKGDKGNENAPPHHCSNGNVEAPGVQTTGVKPIAGVADRKKAYEASGSRRDKEAKMRGKGKKGEKKEVVREKNNKSKQKTSHARSAFPSSPPAHHARSSTPVDFHSPVKERNRPSPPTAWSPVRRYDLSPSETSPLPRRSPSLPPRSPSPPPPPNVYDYPEDGHNVRSIHKLTAIAMFSSSVTG